MLGELLLRHGIISDPQLADALVNQKGSGEYLGQILVEAGAITKEQLEEMLAVQRESTSERVGA